MPSLNRSGITPQQNTSTVIDAVSRATMQQAERRQLTVMFCDLVGSTALSQRLDPEDLRDLILTFQQCCADVVSQFDGYVARYMGDGLLVYFGYPNAHELDAERAVRAGLGIVDQVRSLTVTGDPLQVRVGIETGLVVAGDIIGQGEAQEHSVLGDTPNVAARLQAVATPDSVVIGPGTRRLVGTHFALKLLGMQQLKGISTPLPAYQVQSVTEQPRIFSAVPMLGRETQLASLAEALDSAVQSDASNRLNGRGCVVVIEAESGFGKTRLLEQCVHSAAGRLERAVLRCSPFYRDRPMYPVIRHWQSLLEITQADEIQNPQRSMISLLQSLGLKDRQLQRHISSAVLGHTLESSAQDAAVSYDEAVDQPVLNAAEQRVATREAFIELIRVCSQNKPMLIAVEDAHWIDSSTEEFLASLAQQIEQMPVVLIITSRTPLTLLPAQGVPLVRLPLPPLPEPVLSQLVDAIAADRELPDSIRQQILQRCDGSPLYVEELTKTVIEQQLSAAESGKSSPLGADENPVFQVPSSLHDSLRSRLDRLGETKETAQFVSVLGRQFSYRLILATTPFSVSATDQALADLIAADLLVCTGSGDRRGYAFRHMMLQEVAYQSLLNRTRRGHHRRIATAIREQFADMVVSAPEVIALHYEAAGMIEQAVAHWQQAGRNASAAWAHVEAVNNYSRAIRLLELPSNQVGEGVSPPAELQRIELALRLDLVRSLRILERIAEGLEQLQLAERIALRLQHQQALAEIYNLTGNLYFSRGDIDGCLSNHQAAIDAARESCSVVGEIQALSGIGDANLLLGHAATAENAFDRCVTLCRRQPLAVDERQTEASSDFSNVCNDPSPMSLDRYVAPNLSLRGHVRLYLNRLQESEQDVLEAIALATLNQDLRTEMVARGSCLAKTLCESGRFQDAREHSKQALEVARKLGVLRFEALYLLFVARSYYNSDSSKLAVEYADQAIDIARSTGFLYVGAIAYGIKALVMKQGQKERLQVLAAGEELLASNTMSQNYFWFLRDAIEVSLIEQSWQQAGHYADLLQQYTKRQPLPWSDCYIEIARCTLALRQPQGSSEKGGSANDERNRWVERVIGLRQQCQQGGMVAAGQLIDKLLPIAQD